MDLQPKRLRLRREKHSPPDVGFTATEALRGLPSQLVINLARLAGATMADLSVTLQLMPYGDRAIMKAYGLVTIEPKDADGNRRLTAQPFCLEVIAAAAELVASVVDPNDVAARLANDAEQGHLYDETPFVPAVPESEQRTEGELTVGAVVQESFWKDGQLLVRLAFPDTGLPVIGEIDIIAAKADLADGIGTLVVTDPTVELQPFTTVKLAYPLRDVLRSATLSVAKREGD